MKTLFKHILVLAVLLGTCKSYANATLEVLPTFNSVKKGNSISVTDAVGEVIFSGLINYDGNISRLYDFSQLKDGIYTIEVEKSFEIEVSIVEIKNLKGIVLESYGAGNAPTYKWFINHLEKAIKSGIQIVNVTQCVGGSVILGHYETSVDLKRIKVIDGKDITTESAVAKLMYLLGVEIPNKDFKKVFEKPLRGELDF